MNHHYNYGAPVERGIITNQSQDGYTIDSRSRDGVSTPALHPIDNANYKAGDLVYFFLFDDGHGAILAAIDR